MKHFLGLMAAPFTPFDADGNVNQTIIPAYVDKLVSDGLKGIFVCGSNGEGPNMTVEERMRTAKAFTEAAASRLKVFVHVGHSSIKESRKLASHAESINADAISCVSAFYFKPGSEEELAEALAEIASAAPGLPFYYYHIPHLTGVDMDLPLFLEISSEKIPNLAGIKYTASTLWEYQLCRHHSNGKFDILYGMDEMLLPALAVGAQGFIGSTYNFAAPLYLEVMQNFHDLNLEEARNKMLYLAEVVTIITRLPSITAQKAIMKRLGLDLGPSRRPLVTLSNAQEAELLSKLDEVRFFEKLLAVTSTANGL